MNQHHIVHVPAIARYLQFPLHVLYKLGMDLVRFEVVYEIICGHFVNGPKQAVTYKMNAVLVIRLHPQNISNLQCVLQIDMNRLHLRCRSDVPRRCSRWSPRHGTLGILDETNRKGVVTLIGAVRVHRCARIEANAVGDGGRVLYGRPEVRVAA